LEKNIKHLPENIKIYVYSYDNGDNRTAIFRDFTRLDINLKQLRDIHKGREKRPRNTPIFKKFRDLVLFAIYHELGHYKLSKYYYNNTEHYYLKSEKLYETKADKFSRVYLKKRGILK
jgi:hypothetical protein